jgi:hypothetical protein
MKDFGGVIGKKPIGEIRVGELREYLPGFVEWLLQDSYYTVNSYWKPAPWANKYTGLPDVRRAEKYLQWLCACYVDIDVGRPPEEHKAEGDTMTWRDGAALLGNIMDEGRLPQASIFARSGRGLYALWILRDENDPSKLPRAYPDVIERYKEINRAIGETLTNIRIPADTRAFDAARILRVPGSVSTKPGGGPCPYVIQVDPHTGHGYSYTLPELARALNIPLVRPTLPEGVRGRVPYSAGVTWRITKKPGSKPNRAAGFRELNARRAQDVATIEAWKGGIQHGFRRLTLAMYGGMLKGAGAFENEVLGALLKMAANCRPPYPSDYDDPPISEIMRHLKPKLRYQNARLCRYFGITPDVARDLQLKTIVPPELRQVRRSRQMIDADRQARHEAILQIVRELNGWPPSLRAMVDFLAERGIRTNRDSVARDYQQFKIISRGAPGRPPKNPAQSEPLK